MEGYLSLPSIRTEVVEPLTPFLPELSLELDPHREPPIAEKFSLSRAEAAFLFRLTHPTAAETELLPSRERLDEYLFPADYSTESGVVQPHILKWGDEPDERDFTAEVDVTEKLVVSAPVREELARVVRLGRGPPDDEGFVRVQGRERLGSPVLPFEGEGLVGISLGDVGEFTEAEDEEGELLIDEDLVGNEVSMDPLLLVRETEMRMGDGEGPSLQCHVDEVVLPLSSVGDLQVQLSNTCCSEGEDEQMLGEDLLDEGGAKGVNGDVPRLELNRERLELPHIEDDEDPGWEIVLRRWRGIAHLENNLSWAPFPLRLAFVRPTEVLNYDEEFLSRIESFGEVGLDSLPNPCLTEEDVEDVKTVVGSEQPDRMHQLLQKRKMQFSQTQPPKKPRTDSSSLLDQGLSNFIKIRGIVEKTPERQSKPVKKAAPIPALPRPETDITPFPTPALANASRDMQIVVSTSIAAQRSTMRQLKTLLPGLDVIERDSIIDADITISPSTGLIMTTLAKIKQRSLPGQAARQVSIRERIAAIALRYEKLVILVEGSSSMDEHDCMAWGDFLGYTAILDAAVQVTHVASEPVNWMATYILLHSTADLGVTLLPEETMWERFLRAGGLNSWAAQYALARLKDQPRPGLAAFALPVAECMQRLVDVVGKRVLRHSVGAMTSSSACTATTATGP